MTDTTQFSQQVRDFLQQHGSRTTLARLKIFKELVHCKEDSFDADDINRKLQENAELMAASTVYKTLRQLCSMGLLVDKKTASGNLRYQKTSLFQGFVADVALDD